MPASHALITFLRWTGLGFRRDLLDAVLSEEAEEEVEVEDIDVGLLGGMALDLDFQF